MNVSTFSRKLRQLRERSSTNEKQELIRGMADDPAAISFLSGSEFDDIGLGKKSVLSVAQDIYGDEFSGKPTVSEALYETNAKRTDDGQRQLETLRNDIEFVAKKSGNDQKEALRKLFRLYDYPSVVSHAVLNDWPTGVSDTTIANALDIRDSLPFYESVVDIVGVDDPTTKPVVGQPFSPMLAVPESRGRPDNPIAQRKVDGYRCLIHLDDIDKDDTDAERFYKVHAFSRRMNEVTESLPELLEINWPEGSYIFDAEVIAETGSYSDTSERIGRKSDNVERDVEMNFKLFDMVLDDGEHIHDESYKDRLSALLKVSGKIHDKRVDVLSVSNDIESAKDRAIANGEEGIIVKDSESPYQFDKRSSYWQKVKMDDETVDVVISGFEEGEGKATGTLGKVYIESSDGVPLGASGSGFSDAQREEVWNNQEDWLGRTIEVEARGLGSQDKLRMPIFKRSRSEDGEPDSWERIQEVMQDV